MAGQLRLATNINRTELPESPKKGNPSGKSSNCVSLVASPFARSTISSFRMSPDDCPVSLAQQAESPDIIVGILHKLIHVRGWRPRFFVLREGILRYYKIHGETAINVKELLRMCREEGNVQIIGTEVSRQERMAQRAGGYSLQGVQIGTWNAPGKVDFKPQGEIHVQVVNLRTSAGDPRKMYLHTGVRQVQLRAECRDDRRAWLNAILANKGRVLMKSYSTAILPSMGSGEAAHPADETSMSTRFKSTVQALTGKLKAGGVKMELIEEVEKVLAEEHVQMCNLLGAEMEKRRRLAEVIQQVQEDKRKLETAIIMDVNQQAARSTSNNTNVDTDDGEDYEEDASFSSEEVPTSTNRTLDDSSDDDEFFDCEPGHKVGFPSSSSPPSDVVRSRRKISMTEFSHSDFLEGEPIPKRRSTLPVPREKEHSVSLWAILRDCIGKDLTRICLPVFFNEPISALQKGAEDMEYSELLDLAAACPTGSQKRLLYVAAFAASSYSSTPGRTRKPFNPLLGETYELVMPEKGFRFVSEKVCHHPTILCAWCEGRGWVFQGDGEVKSKFWGRYIELHPVGTMRVTFQGGDVYTWHKVVTSINNLILGKLYIDHGGIMRVVHEPSGLQAKIRFKETGMMDRNPRQVRGHLEDANGQKLPGTIVGKWDEYLAFHESSGAEEVLWKANPPPPPNSNRYNMTSFSMLLNEILEPAVYAPTDCRLRPDQRALEDGRYNDADREKQRLEHKQRQARKAAQEGVPFEPRWFEKVEGVELGEDIAFSYKGSYFECRANGEFPGCRDIFGGIPERPGASA